jgi:hypothetical protein
MGKLILGSKQILLKNYLIVIKAFYFKKSSTISHHYLVVIEHRKRVNFSDKSSKKLRNSHEIQQAHRNYAYINVE